MASTTIFALLSEPFEYVDLAHSMSMTIQVTAFEDGSGLIHPTNPSPKHVRQHIDQNGLTEPPASGTPIGVQVPVLRLFGSRIDKASPSPYWDISSRTLQAQLLPLLDVQAGSTSDYRVRSPQIGYQLRQSTIADTDHGQDHSEWCATAETVFSGSSLNTLVMEIGCSAGNLEA